MRWPVLFIAAYLLLGLDLGLRPLLEVGSGAGIAPSLLLVLTVFVAASAPPLTTAWAALVLGGLVDLVAAYDAGPDVAVILGPHALGYAAGAWTTLQLRAVVYRRHPLTMTLLTLVAGITAQLVVAGFVGARNLLSVVAPTWWDVITPGAATTFLDGSLAAVYAAVVALPLGWILNRLSGAFGFVTAHRPFSAYR